MWPYCTDDAAIVSSARTLEHCFAFGTNPCCEPLAALERARDLDEAAAAAELDRLRLPSDRLHAQLNLNVLSARPDLMASRAERLAVAAAEALTTRDNWRDNQTWSALIIALPDADFRRVGRVCRCGARALETVESGRTSVHLGERLIYKIGRSGIGRAAAAGSASINTMPLSIALASVVASAASAPGPPISPRKSAQEYSTMSTDPHGQECAKP